MSWSIKDLETKDDPEFCRCLESWSAEMKESGDHRERWLGRMKDRGLGVKLAVSDTGAYAGMIQYYPTEYSPVETEENGLWFIHCIWVHGYKKGQGNFQKRGIGCALLEAAEKDIEDRGGRGILAWGITLPFWMRSKWYKKHGYASLDIKDSRELVYKDLGSGRINAAWRRPVKKPPPLDDTGRLQVTMFLSGACSVSGLSWERLKIAAKELPVSLNLIDSSSPENLDQWGWSDILFVGSRIVPLGPPPSTAKLRRIIRMQLKRQKKDRP